MTILSALLNPSEVATADQGANADTAFSWGDHSLAGYFGPSSAFTMDNSVTPVVANFGTDNVRREILFSDGRARVGYNGSQAFLQGGTSKELVLQVNGTTDALTIDTSGNITISGTIDGRDLAADGAVIDGLATVATSGSYTDLTNQPTIPSAGVEVLATYTVTAGDTFILMTLPTSGYSHFLLTGWIELQNGSNDIYMRVRRDGQGTYDSGNDYSYDTTSGETQFVLGANYGTDAIPVQISIIGANDANTYTGFVTSVAEIGKTTHTVGLHEYKAVLDRVGLLLQSGNFQAGEIKVLGFTA